MSKLVYRDFDEFANGLAGMEGHFVPISRQTAEWWIHGPNGHCNLLQAFQIGSPATFAGQGRSGTVTVAAPIAKLGHIRVNGHVLGPDEFILLDEDQPFTLSGQGVVSWVGITVPKDTSLIAPALLLRRPGGGPRIRTAQAYLDHLRHIVSRTLFDLDTATASGTESVPPVMTVEQEIALCLARVLEHSTTPLMPRRVTRPQIPRSRIIAPTLALIDSRQTRPLFLGDLCRVAQVSERTLRNIFYDYFGLGPMRLLKAIQLQNIRSALLRADPERDKVTRIASRYGVHDFSLFARNYRAMFGEPPSDALRAPPPRVRSKRSRSGWLYYAARMIAEDGALLTQGSTEVVKK